MKKLIIISIAFFLALALCSCITIQAPISTASPVISAQTPSSSLPVQSRPVAASPGKAIDDNEALSYFSDVALKSEYGGDDFTGIVRRWEEPIRVAVHSGYTDEDYRTLENHVHDLSQIKGFPPISIVQEDGNYNFYFVPLDQMAKVVPGYVEGNWGFVSLTWDEQGRIDGGTIGIATDVTNQVQRNHLILEEMTQGLGLLNDSPKYMDSIYQGAWTEVQSLTDLDWLLVKMLYSSAIHAGMHQDEALPALKNWLDSNP